MLTKRFKVLVAAATVALIGSFAGPAQAGHLHAASTKSTIASVAQLDRLQIPPPSIGATAAFRIMNDASPSDTPMCLGIANNSARGAGLWAPCTYAGDQVWHWGDRHSANSRYVQLVNGDGRCLGTRDRAVGDTTRIIAGNCDGEVYREQYWAWTGSHSYIVNFKGLNQVIGTLNGRIAQGQELILFHDTGDRNQFWTALY